MEPNKPQPRRQDWFTRLANLLEQHWHPEPIAAPHTDPELEQLSGVQRSAEVIRYSILSLEFWLSPFGRLREWLRLNAKLGVILLLPAILVMPVVTWIIYLVSGWAAMLLGLAGNLLLLPFVALLALGAIFGAVAVLRSVFGK